YFMPELSPGSYQVTASSDQVEAFADASALIKITEGEVATLDLDLDKAASIDGVVGDQHGAAVPDAFVLLVLVGGTDGGFAIADVDGKFHAPMLLGGGDYRVTVRPSSRSRAEFPASNGAFPLIHVPDAKSHVQGVTLQVRRDQLAITGRV